jgi:hypothetical protein
MNCNICKTNNSVETILLNTKLDVKHCSLCSHIFVENNTITNNNLFRSYLSKRKPNGLITIIKTKYNNHSVKIINDIEINNDITHDNNKYDIVILFDIMCKTKDHYKIIEVVQKLLSNNGILIIQTPLYFNQDYLLDNSYLSFFTTQSIQKFVSQFHNLTLNNVFDFGCHDRIYEIKLNGINNEADNRNSLINTNLIPALIYDMDNNIYDDKYGKSFQTEYYHYKNYYKLLFASLKPHYKVILYKSIEFGELYDIIHIFDYTVKNVDELRNIDNSNSNTNFLLVSFFKHSVMQDKLDIFMNFYQNNININNIKVMFIN